MATADQDDVAVRSHREPNRAPVALVLQIICPHESSPARTDLEVKCCLQRSSVLVGRLVCEERIVSRESVQIGRPHEASSKTGKRPTAIVLE